MLAEELAAADGIAAVDVAGPGFLNITVEAGAQGAVAADVVAAGELYGHSEALAGQKSTWSSSRPTRPVRCTSATPAGRSSGTRSVGSSRPPVPR